MPKGKDWADIKIHRLTFVRPTERRICQKIVWEALCECGKITQVVPQNVKTGHIKSCGCLKNAALVKSNKERRKYTPLISSARSVWAANYNDIDFETFFSLSQLSCKYCGTAPHRTRNVGDYRHYPGVTYRSCTPSKEQVEEGNFTYNGLDRIDSSLGHTLGNVVPCCWICNRMKSDMGADVFLSHIERIHYHSTLRKR